MRPVSLLAVVVITMLLPSACAHRGKPVQAASPARRAGDARAAPAPAPARPRLLPAGELPSLDLATRVGAYLARDAVWVAGHPLAVNRDYDFMTALAMESIGPALAARRRRDGNVELARRLAELAPPDDGALLDAFCSARERRTCVDLAGRSLRIYGLLFGEASARLLVVVEVEPGGGSRASQHAALVELADAGGLDARALQDAFATGLVAIANEYSAELPPASAAPTDSASCRLSPATKLTGTIIARSAQYVQLLVPETQRLLCPVGAVIAGPEPGSDPS